MTARIRFGNSLSITRTRVPDPLLGEIREEAMRGLGEASVALGAAGIRHWLTYGALLGLVREGQLLAHDGDIDFVIADRPDPRAVTAALAGAGFAPTRESVVGGRVANQKFARGPVLLDLFHVDREGEVYLDRAPFDRFSLCVGTHPAMALTPLDCAGFAVPAPADREAYLSHLYGPDWRQPVLDWDWRLSPPNMTIHLHWRSAGFLAWKLLVRRLRRKPAAA